MMTKYIVFFVAILNFGNVYSQVPSNDPTWTSVFAEEFNANPAWTWVQNKTYLQNNGWHFGWRSNADWISTFNQRPEYAYYFTQDGSNMKINDGALKISLAKNDPPYAVRFDSLEANGLTHKVVKLYPYTTGHLHMTIPQSYLIDSDYGYYEMKYRLNTPTMESQGVQTNFWLFGSVSPVTYCELDIFEINGLDKWYTHNFHHKTTLLPFKTHNLTNFDDIYGNGLRPEDFSYYTEASIDKQTDSAGFHVIGCEVTPGKITFYQDNIFLRSIEVFDNNRIENLAVMQMEINNILPTGFYHNFNDLRYPNANTTFPNEFEIDYIRFYKLNCGDGVNPIITPDNFDATTYNHEVVQSVTLGTDLSGAQNTVENGVSVVIRSIGDVILNDGFYVDDNSFFYATNCICEN